MKNNSSKSNYLKSKAQQIKVNRKTVNNNYVQSLNQASLSKNFYQQKQNKLIQNENKNIKIQEYLDTNSYINKNTFTESNSSPKYSIFPLNSFKSNKFSPTDKKQIYNNTNGNINKEQNLKNKNKLNINLNNDKKLFKNYTNREIGKVNKLGSFKQNKKSNPINMKINSKPSINQNNIFQKVNLYGPKNVNQNTFQKNKYQSYNKSNHNNINKYNNNGVFNINLDSQKMPNKNEKIKKYNIISPNTSHNSNKKHNKKMLHQNKSSLAYKRKNNTIISPDPININTDYIPTMKNSNSNGYYKCENPNIYTYNSCYNFYQKTNNNNLITKNNPNPNNLNMLNTINNFGYLNINNSVEGNINKLNPLLDSINNEDIYQNESAFFTNINTIDQDIRNNRNIINKNKNCILNSNIKNNENINIIRHKKGKLSESNINFYNSGINTILNKNNSQFIKYNKNIIEEFCHCLEEFIFMNVKNNFDTFIIKLKNYSKEQNFNSLLLKRLQNKTIQKDFYKEKSASYKNLDQNSTNPHYSSIIMMNNSNIINVQRKGDYINNDFSKEFCGRKTVYNFRHTRSPPMTEKMEKIQKNYRFGKSQDEPLDINNIDNYNYYNNNTYFHNNNLLEDYNNFNNFNNYNYYNNSNYKRKNNNYKKINNLINIEDDEERKSLIKYDTNFNDNNLYIPKKFKKMKNNKALSKSNDRQNRIINDTDISNPYINKIKAKKIFSKKLSPQNENNKSHDLNNDIIRAKMKNNNYFKKYNNIINYNNSQDMSCDINSNYNIIKENETILNKTNDTIIKRNNTELNPRNTYDFKNNDNIPVYKKKIKISQTKTKIYMNKAAPNNIRNKMIKLNCSNKTADQLLSPNFDKNNKNINKNFEKIITTNLANSQNLNKIRSAYTEPRKEINNNLREIEQNKCGIIQELTVNLPKNEYNLTNNINDNENANDIKKGGGDKILNNGKEQINQAQTQTNKENNNEKSINENINQDNTNNKNENNTNNDNETDNNNNTETITINNDNNDYNAMSNDNNIVNDDTDESDDNTAKEIIVKDVSTRDRRLNVFIKYVELSQFNTLNNEFNNCHLINSFKTDSIYVPSLYPSRKNRNYYYDKYFYGNKNDKNNKLKLHQILSSIIEEEEKSKAAGSINNSFLSEEETSKIGNNYSHFFIQSIKYVSNYLQNIFDDKKKDMYFQFLKILKKIKNESFLRGLINQKKFQTLTKLKEDEKDNQSENNNSEDIILYNNNDNSKDDLSFKNQENDINKNNKYIEECKYITNKNTDIGCIKKSLSNKNILKIDKSCYPFDDIDLKKNESFSYKNLQKEKRNEIINNNKLKQIIINMEDFRNWILIEKTFKNWKKEINYKENKEEDSDIQMDYEKNITISEACRGLSDVILDFKIYLIKYSIKNRNGKE